MKKLTFMMLGLLLVAGTATAEEITGTVSNVDLTTQMLTVQKDDGQEVQVTLNQDAEFKGGATSVADIQTGAQVTLDADEQDGSYTAKSVEVTSAGDATAADATTTGSDTAAGTTAADASGAAGTTATETGTTTGTDTSMTATSDAGMGSTGADAATTGSTGATAGDTGSTSASAGAGTGGSM